MELTNLPTTTKKKLRRLGQGHGSGRGKTSGRGTKGQKARGRIPTFFEGGALPLTKRMPFLRGRGRNKIMKRHLVSVNISDLNKLKGKVVDVENLIASGLVEKSAKLSGAKLIGKGTVSGKFEVKIPTSVGARSSIEAAGGTVS